MSLFPFLVVAMLRNRNEEIQMSTKSKVKKIVLSFIVLTLTAALTYYADSPSSVGAQSVAVVTDIKKI